MRNNRSGKTRAGAGMLVLLGLWATTILAQAAVLFEDDFDRAGAMP